MAKAKREVSETPEVTITTVEPSLVEKIATMERRDAASFMVDAKAAGDEALIAAITARCSRDD